MGMIKEINQNQERYSTKSDKYQITASPDIKPLDLVFGKMPDGLLPVLEVDGIIVNVDEYKLISQSTLDLIKKSNNPHYDVKDNGIIKTTSGKVGKIGQTIPTITIDIDKLISVGKQRDILNRIGGVTDVNYIYEGALIEGTILSEGLIQQINYTLNPNIDRPMDEYTLLELQLSDEKNYDLSALKITTKQSDEKIFDNTKLEAFLTGVKERMKALTVDFHTIRDIHYNGDIPNDWPTYVVKKRATAEDEQEEGDFQIVTKTSKLISVEKTPAQLAQEAQQTTTAQLNNTIQDAVATQQAAIASSAGASNRTEEYIQQQLDFTRIQLQQLQQALQ